MDKFYDKLYKIEIHTIFDTEVISVKNPNKILLTPDDLAARWRMTSCTLSQWRWNGKGPPYIKMGKGILYDLEVIERFESKRIRYNTSQKEFYEILIDE